jgi:hypothetical protein
MPISDFKIEQLLPPYLTEIEKGRIKKGLEQFFQPNQNKKTDELYKDFYLENSPKFYLLQSDIINSIKTIGWNEEKEDYYSGYQPAMLVSNSCDVTDDNARSLNQKEALFAPVLPLNEVIKDYEKAGFSSQQINNFCNTLRKQEFSNLFYLPKNHINQKEYLVHLDKIFWHPITSVKKVNKNLQENRFISLSNFGYYLFLVKVSFHICRLPEEIDRTYTQDIIL